VSKERARRRAEREAAKAVAEARRLRRDRRRAWRRRVVRSFKPKVRRRAWLLARRSPGQRALIIGVGIAALGAIWYMVDSWPLRVAFTLLLVLLLPVLVIVTFDRRV
jgi:Flp pilus assembly protein TadB